MLCIKYFKSKAKCFVFLSVSRLFFPSLSSLILFAVGWFSGLILAQVIASMPSFYHGLVPMGRSAKDYLSSRRKEVNVILRLLMAVVFIPGFLSAIGAIVERAIYGVTNRPNFSPVMMLFGGFIAAPFILIRWFWPVKLKCHLNKLEFVYYVLFSVGFIVAVVTTTVAGNELFYTGQHVRSIFGGKDSTDFMNIDSRPAAYTWLNQTFSRIYTATSKFNRVSRELPGRIMLNGPIRLSQFRVVPESCSSGTRGLSLVSTGSCFGSSKQDKGPFSRLNISYRNVPYRNYVGDWIYPSDVTLKGTLDTYPLAGHWVMFGPDFQPSEVHEMLGALEASDWIDDQTRMISLDCTVIAPDFPRTTVVSTIHIVEVTLSGHLVPASPSVNFNFLDDSGSSNDTVFSNGMEEKCSTVMEHPDFFLPIYLGILPALVYTVFVHVLIAYCDWRKCLYNPFFYTEFAWFVTVMLSVIFRWRSIYFDHCDLTVVPQQVYPQARHVAIGMFEYIPIAEQWFESRRVLGLALFLHLFNFLKFIVQIPALSSLIRTMKIAFNELASFSLSFLVVFFAFVFMFYIIFSVESKDYQNLPRCISTLWLGMLGELSITPELWRVKDWTIPMIVLFTFISVFVLLTVIIAIISDAHERSREEREKEEEKRRAMAKKALGKWRPFGKRHKSSRENNTLAVFSSDLADLDRQDSSFANVVSLAVATKRESVRHARNASTLGRNPESAKDAEGASSLEAQSARADDIIADPQKSTSAKELSVSSRSPEGGLVMSSSTVELSSTDADDDQTRISRVTKLSAAKFLRKRQPAPAETTLNRNNLAQDVSEQTSPEVVQSSDV